MSGPDLDDVEYYSQLGFKAGLEIHQQLDTNKLFCACPSELDEEVQVAIRRRLAPTQSELGEVDAAALAEAEKRLVFHYETNDGSCLVEADEEPPHPVNMEALEISLLVARLLNAKPVDEVHFMRKIVIDGSNTTGFQRTALYARDGAIEGYGVGIEGLWLEEDAARRIDEPDEEGEGGEHKHVASVGGERVATFRLDRLGIPLIEIATAPDVRTPAEMRTVAERLGTLLRATRRVKRGLGTIRQDLNVSITGGVRVEIKGVQDLRSIPEYVAEEVERQRGLVAVREELKRRAVTDGDIQDGPTDVSAAFAGTKSKVLAGALKRGGVVLGLRLGGFGGLLKGEPVEGVRRRLGAELAGYAIAMGLKGIFHSDELPAYGVTPEEVVAVARELSCGDGDAFVIAAGERSVVSTAMEAVAERARATVGDMPREVRGARPDGTTRYLRPLPGSARMYPETDIPPVRVTREMREAIAQLPVELPEEWVARVSGEHGLTEAQVEQLLNRGQDAEFEGLAASHDPKLVARVLLSSLPELERDGVDVSRVDGPAIADVLGGVASGIYSKEAVGDVLRAMVEGGVDAASAAAELGLTGVAADDLRDRIHAIVEERSELVRERGRDAMGPLMGVVMAEFRGKADGKELSQLLSEAIDALLGGEG
jgi:glutamyl-tRNA(Gln) amidotransferase subunit E